jgi:hypothetical protein
MTLHPDPIAVEYRGNTIWVHAPTPRDFFEVNVYLANDPRTSAVSEQDRTTRLGLLLGLQCARKGQERTSERLFPDLATAEESCPFDLATQLAIAVGKFLRGVEDQKNFSDTT